ncbi:MAG: hypothetical protein ETSY2_42105, partial [Candidatus Entotheonella gemina]
YQQGLDGDIQGTRVGVLTELLNDEQVEPEVREAVVNATAVLKKLGARVEEVSVPLTQHANVISAVLLAVEPAQNHRDWVRTRLQDYGHDNRIGLLTGSLIPAQAYLKAQKLRSLLRQQILEALKTVDVLISPTSGRSGVAIQDDPVITSKETTSRLPFMRTNTFNLASSPAISVPCGFSSQGLPIGLQIGGAPGGEEAVLKLAYAYEQSTSWHTMRPPAL